MEIQVTKDNYVFTRYSRIDRWASYHYQINEILKTNPKRVLEVGVGEGILRDYFSNKEIKYACLDFAADLKPDFVGSVDSIPIESNSFDTVCAFEVLEHLPFEKFNICLAELARVSRKNVLISLPHFGPQFKFVLKVPFLKEIKFAYKLYYPRTHEFDGQHYWEIGKKNYPVSKIIENMNKFFLVKRHFVPFENQYHHFFILEKR